MYHIKQDQRSQRSAETIYNALTALITSQPFDSITVSDLVKQADVARGTFYRNFDTIEDVLRWRCDETIDALLRYVINYRLTDQDEFWFPFLKPVLRFFYLDSSIVELLISAERLDLLQVALQKKISETKPVIPQLDGIPKNYLIYGAIIRSSAAVHIVAHWVANGKQNPPDELADELVEMARLMSNIGTLY